jgi:hypothetical protein
MIDSQFIQTLQEAEAKGKAGVEEMRAILKDNGGMKRLLSIAAQTIPAPKVGGRVVVNTTTRIPDDFPGETDKQKAIGYWERKRRPDLVAKVEEIAEHFHAHHLGKGTRAASWPSTWQTWYSNQIEFVRPPREGDLFLASVTPLIEQTNIPGWIGRLESFYGDNGSPAGTWLAKWGGKPPVKPSDTIPENCACPTQAFALYLENRKRRA